MRHQIGDLLLRPLEESDESALYRQKNDPDIAAMLGGFASGYSRQGVRNWLEYHHKREDEVLWAIEQSASGELIGHVGLYKIDFRIRVAEYAILIGERAVWGKGYGKSVSRFVIGYGFGELNLNRIQLSVLTDNTRAIRLYEDLGFKEEGSLRQAQYKGGRYRDVLLMGLLREEYERLSER